MIMAMTLLGILLLIAGCVSLIVPLKFIGITSRKLALIPLVVGIVIMGFAGTQLNDEYSQAAKEAGFESLEDYRHAKELGMSTPAEYAPVKAKALAAAQAKAEAEAKEAGFASLADFNAAKEAGYTNAAAYAQHLKVEAFFTVPAAQAQFVKAVQAATASFHEAKNDLAKGGTRSKRKQDVCAALSSLNVQNWVGKIENLSSNSEGMGVVSVQLAKGVTVKTWNNAFSDIGDNTLIDPSSALFSRMANLNKGQRVKFSGSFMHSDLDCVQEPSFTLAGSMTEPEYIMQFHSIEIP